MSFVAITDFVGQNNIPDKETIANNLQWFIDKYEPMFLKELLGDELYTLLIATPDEERFVDLLTYLMPAIVDYVYWFYLEDMAIQNLGTGAAQSKKQLAVTVSPYPKMVRAWNEMVDYNKKTNKFLDDNKTVYPEYTKVLPTWYYSDGWYPQWDWNWYSIYGCFYLPEIYRVKNSLGI